MLTLPYMSFVFCIFKLRFCTQKICNLPSPYPTPLTKGHVKMLLFLFSFLLNNIPSSEYATFYLSTHQLTLGHSTF